MRRWRPWPVRPGQSSEPPWLLSTDLMVVQVALSSDTCSRYWVAWAFSQSMWTRLIGTVLPKSSVRYWLSVKPLLQRVVSSWSMAAAADRSPRSEALAVALTGVSTVSGLLLKALSMELWTDLLLGAALSLPPPQAASAAAKASAKPGAESLRSHSCLERGRYGSRSMVDIPVVDVIKISSLLIFLPASVCFF